MIQQLEYLNLPTKLIILIVAFLVVSNLVGEFLEFKGKVVPEFIKMRKYFARKKQEREIVHKLPETLNDVQKTLNDIGKFYSPESLKKRDTWIDNVNHKLEQNDKWIKEFDRKLEKNNDITMSLWVDDKRNCIIRFASEITNEKKQVTREQFHRIFKIHNEYEKMIENLGITNGETDIAMRIITESYEKHMKNGSFIEDVRGY